MEWECFVGDEFGITWNEVAVIYFIAPFQHLHGGARQIAGNVGCNIWSVDRKWNLGPPE